MIENLEFDTISVSNPTAVSKSAALLGVDQRDRPLEIHGLEMGPCLLLEDNTT